MPSVDRTMEQALAEIRDKLTRSTPQPDWTVLVVERAGPDEIEAAAKSLAAIRAALPVLDTITNRRKLTPRQRRAEAIYAEHDPVVRAFAERYQLRVTERGVFETTYPWSGRLDTDKPFHVEQRLREPAESGGLILWTVIHPGEPSAEELAIAEMHEARRKRRVEGYRDDESVTVPTELRGSVERTQPPPEPAPRMSDEQRRAQARESFERRTSEWSATTGLAAKRWRGCDHAPSAHTEFEQARRERRVRVRGVDFFGSTTPRGKR